MTEEEYTEKVLHIKTCKDNPESAIEEKIRRTAERDAFKIPLRIDEHTVILVDEENATEEYAREWKRRRRWAR